MYNTDLPTREELPSSRRLIFSTIIAMAVAGLLLMTTVLPAEYGIDPTGIGRLLGLKKMGEIKVSLQEQAEDEAAQKAELEAESNRPVKTARSATTVVSNSLPVSPAVIQPQTVLPVRLPKNGTTSENVNASVSPTKKQNHEMTFTLKPGAAVEIKMKMLAKTKVDYQWEAKGGLVNYNTHGDAVGVTGKSFCYGKGTQVARDIGVLIAEFDGKHGWFWRNRSEKTVVVILKTNGQYSEIKRVL